MGIESPNASRVILWRPAAPKTNGAGHHPALYWAPRSQCPMGQGIVAFSTDDKPQFVYEPFNQGRDFGPLDIARTVMYCRWVEALCNAHTGCSALVHVVSDTNRRERANTVALCGAFLVLCSGATAEEAFQPFALESFPAFVDCRGEADSETAADDQDFRLAMLDVLRGLQKARDLRWVDYRVFDVEDHSSSLRPERGDMTWLLPGRAIAFASPWSEPIDGDGFPVCTPAQLCPYFLRHGVSLVVQCNDPQREEEGERQRLLRYDPQSFRDVGVQHLLIPFEDGGCPSVELILRFLAEVEALNGGFAVHCRSGLGRTATLIGIYAMRHLGFTARSFIGWSRAMRPGTVHGSQQQYLVNLEPYLRPGATRSLRDLSERECLFLLPRRELRFWSLDFGIPAERTGYSDEAEMVEMILQVKGTIRSAAEALAAEAPIRSVAPPIRSAAEAPPARALNPVLRTQAQVQGTGNILSKPSGAVSLKPGQLPIPNPALAKSTTATVTASRGSSAVGSISNRGISEDTQMNTADTTVGPQVEMVPKLPLSKVSSEATNRLNSLNAAIASLGQSLQNSTAVTNGAGGAALSQHSLAQKTTAAGMSALGAAPKAAQSGTAADEWAEVLRYLHLHAAMQEGTDSCESLRQTVALLQMEAAHARAAPPSASSSPGGVDGGLAAEVAKLSEANQAAQQQTAEAEQEVKALQRQIQSMKHEHEQLKAQVLRDQMAQQASQAKMEERADALVAGLSQDEVRLEGTVRELEGLRGQVLKRGGLEQQQVDRDQQVRRDIAEARTATVYHNACCCELRKLQNGQSGVTPVLGFAPAVRTGTRPS